MNKMRRKELCGVILNLRSIKDKDDLYSCINELENLKSEEEDYYDNIPENLQGGFRAERSEEAIENLDEALDILNDAYENDDFNLIAEAIYKINDAC